MTLATMRSVAKRRIALDSALKQTQAAGVENDIT
jgi:hypothetical protein